MPGPVALDRVLDLDHQPVARAADAAPRHRHLPAAQQHLGIGPGAQPQRAADLEPQDVAQAHGLLLEHGLQLDAGHPDLVGEMVLPDRVAAELLAHEHLQEQVAGRLQRGVGDQELDRAAPVLEVDPQPEHDAAIAGGRAIAAKRGLVSMRSNRKVTGVMGEGLPQILRIRRTSRSTSEASIVV